MQFMCTPSIYGWIKNSNSEPLGFPCALRVQCGLALGLLILSILTPPLRLFSDPYFDGSLQITLEFLSIAAALMIFTVGWFSFNHERGARFQILACAFLAMAMLDFVHTLAVMPDLLMRPAVEQAIHLWSPTRIISALALLVAALLPSRISLSRRRRGWMLAMTVIAVALFIAMDRWFLATAPNTFVVSQGLAPFKITVEGAVMTLYGVTLVWLIRDWQRERDDFRALLLTGLWILLLGELSQTRYAASADFHKLLGYLYKNWGDGLVFWAIYRQAIDEPHRRLHQSERLLTRNAAQTQALLRENQVLLDNSFVGIFFVQDRRFIRVNHCAETLFGYAPGALNGVSTEVIYPDQAAFLALGECAYPIIHQGAIFAGDMELVRKDGSRFWCLMRGQALTPEHPEEGSIWIMEDVTERRRARQALQDAASLYRAIFESRAVVKVLIDPDDGRIIDANQAAAEFYGIPRDTLQRRCFWEISTQSCEDLLALFADLKAGRAELTVERQSQHRRADHEFCEVGVYFDLIQREHRCFLLATVLDLTERKRVEAAIQTRFALQRELLEAIPTPVFYKDMDGRYQSLNRAFAEFFGRSESELIGKTVYDCWPREAADLFLVKDQALFQNPGVQIYEAQMQNPQGELRNVVFHKAALHYPDGNLRGLIGFILDMTERKAAEDALRASEERLQRVLEGANDGFWDWNVTTGAVLFSRRWAEMLGYDLAEIEPHVHSWEKLVHPDDMPQCWAAVQAHFAGNAPHYQNEHRMLAKNGEYRWVLDRGKITIRDSQGQPLRMAGTHTDITERKRMEEALRVSLAEVQRHHSRMVALNRMNNLLLSCETCEEAHAVIAHSAERLFNGGSGRLAMIGGDATPELRVVATWGDLNTLPTVFLQCDCWALQYGETREVTDRAQCAQCGHLPRTPPLLLCLPLNIHGETLGLLQIGTDQTLSQEQFQDLQTLAITVSESIKLVLSNLKLHEILRKQAIRDALTGLFNRRYLDETLPLELHRRQRRGEPLAAAMLDVDHFKRFNDIYGHEAGDAVLRAIGDLLNHCLRGGDIACRYGGEELTVIMPGSTLDDARIRLDSLREAIMQLRVLYQGANLPTITVSVGVAAAGEREVDAATLLGRADAALYQAKASGRNRVMVSRSLSPGDAEPVQTPPASVRN